MTQVYFLYSLCFDLMLVLPSLVRNLSSLVLLRASLVAQTKTNPSAMQETQVRSLGWEEPLEKGMVYPLQYSCLENPMDREAW